MKHTVSPFRFVSLHLAKGLRETDSTCCIALGTWELRALSRTIGMVLQVKLLLHFLCLTVTPASSNSVCHDNKLRKPVKVIVAHHP